MDQHRRGVQRVAVAIRVTEDRDIVDFLTGADGPQAERAVVIRIAAFDWNCHQHIPFRLTDAERDGEIARLRARIDLLEGALAESSAPGWAPAA
jgi:hypothetical protein